MGREITSAVLAAEGRCPWCEEIAELTGEGQSGEFYADGSPIAVAICQECQDNGEYD